LLKVRGEYWLTANAPLMDRAEAAEQRVAELEAQLAAQGMRDDDDNPNS
jgi:hypothetical protein